jgi:hypothetical protein
MLAWRTPAWSGSNAALPTTLQMPAPIEPALNPQPVLPAVDPASG